MGPKEMTRRVLRELAAERASHGHGEAALIDQRMNKARGYLSRILRGDLGLHVETLFEALDVLDVDAADFFGRVTGIRVCPDRLLRRLERQAPSNGRSVLDRFEITASGGRIDVTIRFDDPPLIEDLPGRLDGLDAELFSYPDQALGSAEEILLAAVARLAQEPTPKNLDLVCQALGALAAADRVQARFGAAARGLRLGFGLCEAMGLSVTRTDLLLRACYLLADHGEYDLAIELARQASDSCLLSRDEKGLGRALVVRGVMLDRAGQHAAAIDAYRLGREHLPADAWIGRYSCSLGLALSFRRLGHLDEARAWVAEATAVHETQGGPNWWRLVWLQGDIALDDQDFESAVELLREAREGLTEFGNPFDVALVSLRLAKVLLMAGRPAQMRELASEMMRLLKPLEKHKVAGAALYEFACATLAGRVTMELLDGIYQKVEKDAPRIGAP
jgi:tetratricopeptide (TPR) repeat protein